MKKINNIIFLFLCTVLFIACSENEVLPTAKNKEIPPQEVSPDRYVLMTYDKFTIPVGRMAGKVVMDSYVTYFLQMPTGNVSNIVAYNTLKGHIGKNGGGLFQMGNSLYRISNSATINAAWLAENIVANTPVRLELSQQGRIREVVYKDLGIDGVSLLPKTFAITNDGRGFICMLVQDELPTVYTFDPYAMTKLSPKYSLSKKKNMFDTKKYDIENILEQVVAITPELAEMKFPAVYIGLSFCEWHNGKLLVDIQFYNEDGLNVAPDNYILAMDVDKTGKWETVSAIKNTGLIGRRSASLQNAHDENGDLYILSKGTDEVGFYRNSKISRVLKDTVIIDKNWELDIKDFVTNGNTARFNGIYVANGKIITMINNAPLSQEGKDMDLENVWDYYSIDIATKQATKINGLQSCSGFVLGANLISKIDGKYYIRYVRTGTDAPYNGYYKYDFSTNTATPAFSISQGGYAVDLKKIRITQ